MDQELVVIPTDAIMNRGGSWLIDMTINYLGFCNITFSVLILPVFVYLYY